MGGRTPSNSRGKRGGSGACGGETGKGDNIWNVNK